MSTSMEGSKRQDQIRQAGAGIGRAQIEATLTFHRRFILVSKGVLRCHLDVLSAASSWNGRHPQKGILRLFQSPTESFNYFGS